MGARLYTSVNLDLMINFKMLGQLRPFITGNHKQPEKRSIEGFTDTVGTTMLEQLDRLTWNLHLPSYQAPKGKGAFCDQRRAAVSLEFRPTLAEWLAFE